MRSIALVSTAILVMAATASAQTLLYTWENDSEGWAAIDGYSDTDGVTDGSYSAFRNNISGYSNAMRASYDDAEIPALQTHSILQVDITTSVDIPSWAPFSLTLLMQGGNFTQTQIPGVLVPDEAPAAPLNGDAALVANTPHTVSFDYSANVEDLQTASGWFSTWFITELYGGYLLPTLYFDNVRLLSPFTVGDMNDDGVIDNLDINPFVLALTDPAQYQTDFGLDPNGVGDINDDGVLDNLDINPFVALLTGPAAGTAVPEPASLALIGLGGLALLRRRR